MQVAVRIAKCLFVLQLCSSFAVYAEPSPNYGAIGLASPQVSFNVLSRPGKAQAQVDSTAYSAQTTSVFTTEASYDGITVGYGFDLKGGNRKDTSKYSNFGLSYFGRFWGINASYVSLTGVDASGGTGQTAASITADPASHRSDIRFTSSSANLWLAPYRNNLDLNDFFSPAGKAHGCGFALVVIASYDSLGIAMQEPLYLSPNAQAYGSDSGFIGGQFYSGSISLGPAFMLERYNFYLAGLLTLGGGEQTGVYRVGDDDLKAKGRPAKTVLYLALGYRGSAYFTVFDYIAEQPEYTLNTIQIQTSRAQLAWTVGRRF